MLTKEKGKELKLFAADIRLGCLKEFRALGSGHVGGSFSICDLMACLYGGIMAVRPEQPRWENRDRFIMSKGHAGPAMYAALALRGFFPYEELDTLNASGTNLPSHTDRNRTPGVDMTTGSLGQGFSSGLGIALGCKMKGIQNHTYILLGDGECQEGEIWEGAMLASAKGLRNVIAFVDANGRQLDGTTDEVLPLGSLAQKFTAFGWNAVDVADGNDVRQVWEAIEDVQQSDKPSVLILHTVKGKGCSFAEGKETNHNMPVSPAQADEASAAINRQKAEIMEE